MARTKTESVYDLAKKGAFDEFVRAASATDVDLARAFERAVTDFRTVKRNPGHQRILNWCLQRGLTADVRAGWFDIPVVCVAAQFGNAEIVAQMTAAGLPDDPYIHAALGDVDFLRSLSRAQTLATLTDSNGFNLLSYCALSRLGSQDANVEAQLSVLCGFLLEEGVDPTCTVVNAVAAGPCISMRRMRQ